MTIKLRKLKRNEKKGKKKIIFYLLANARITKFTAAFNTKIVSFWIKLSSEKADRMYRFFIGFIGFFHPLKPRTRSSFSAEERISDRS